ncbi:mucin TcMUCII [Trypanosoma cruzi]|nr:mucin TcMUCII [Trypanosoma cruzi]
MTLFPLRSSTWEHFIILYGMESTHPAAYCRVVVSGSHDPVEYFVRTKADGNLIIFVMSIGCTSRGPTIHVVCGDLLFTVTLLLCCCVRCASSCVCACPP